MFFNEIIGQAALKKRLVQSVKDGRVSHSQLFFGPEGAGALPLAIAYAQYISCTGEKNDDSCGQCPGCLKYSKLIHPDLHFIFPVNNVPSKKEDPSCDDFLAEWRSFVLQNPYASLNDWYSFIELENKQGLIKEKESLAITKKLSFKSFESDFKIAIIWMSEKMNETASNKLLKLLEEPPDKTIFLLIAENPETLLPTVRSRCFPVKVPRIADEDLKDALKSRHQLDEAQSNTITRLAMGNYTKALELIHEDEDNGSRLEVFREFMLAGYSEDIESGLKVIDTLNSMTREKQKAFLEYGLKMIRENAVKHFNDNRLNFLNPAEEKFSIKFSTYIKNSNLAQLTDEFNKACRDIERNANSKIVLLDLMLKTGGLLRQ
ncbi:MAG: DNA polymerase III subunit delta [Bacteroidales bacterium]|nr:DNA polymerase III subunit delta [Bacteroidales bacterium]